VFIPVHPIILQVLPEVPEVEIQVQHIKVVIPSLFSSVEVASALFCDGFFQERVSRTICLGWL
jgi:hypothetical protein